MSDLFTIEVQCGTREMPWEDLLPILGQCLGVKFAVDNKTIGPGNGCTLVNCAKKDIAGVNAAGRSSLHLPPAGVLSQAGERREFKVQFTEDKDVPRPFRGRTITSKLATTPTPLVLQAEEKVLATCEGGPIWTQFMLAGVKRYRSAIELPSLAPDGRLHEVLSAEKFVALLPLLHWVREIMAEIAFCDPPLRAAFIFDDPNLHWPRYGYVDYGAIAARATAENYHVCFATIPLDTWFTHQKTAELFRNNAKWLSLAVHGNNHTRQELARAYSANQRSHLLHQAIQRIQKLERAGVSVSRVMVPPHGACSEDMLTSLPHCGFESACISHGSLNAHNRTRTWVRSLGFAPVELVNGCPVFPRWGFSEHSENAMLLAAYLGQPMILRGHHQDLKEGIGLLDKHARFINSIGNVKWANLADLSRSHFQWREEGVLCRVQPLSRRMIIQCPPRCTSLVIEPLQSAGAEVWRVSTGDKPICSTQAGVPVALSGVSGMEIELALVDSLPGVEDRQDSVKPYILRRLLTEFRDRFIP